MASFFWKGLARQTNLLIKSNHLSSPIWYSPKNYTSTNSANLISSLPDLKNLTINELSLKQFSTKPEINDLETKYNQIVKSNITNAYNIYIIENRKAFVEKHPGSSVTNTIKELAKNWREMKLEEKIKYVEKANANKAEKKASLEKLFANIKIDEAKAFRDEIKKKRGERRKYLSRTRLKKEQLKHHKPTKPSNSFFLYAQSLDRGDASVYDFTKGAALKWNALAQQDKDVFIKEAKANLEEYKLKMKEWETKMIAEGHAKLVSKSFTGSLQKNLKKLSDDSFSKYREKRAARVKQTIDASKEKAKKLMRKAQAEKKEALKAQQFLVAKTAKAKSQVDKILSKIKSDLIQRKARPKRKIAKKATTASSNNSDSSSSDSSSESDSEKPKTPPATPIS